MATTERSWVIISRVMDMVFSISISSSKICPWVTTSRAVVASSMMSSAGLNMMLNAMFSRCCMPPDSSKGYML